MPSYYHYTLHLLITHFPSSPFSVDVTPGTLIEDHLCTEVSFIVPPLCFCFSLSSLSAKPKPPHTSPSVRTVLWRWLLCPHQHYLIMVYVSSPKVEWWSDDWIVHNQRCCLWDSNKGGFFSDPDGRFHCETFLIHDCSTMLAKCFFL